MKALRPRTLALPALAITLAACSGGNETTPPVTPPTTPTTNPTTETPPSTPTPPTPAGGESFSRGLLLAYASFPVENGQINPAAGRARVEMLMRQNGEWRVESFEDTSSNVFHKAMPFTPPGGQPGILTLGGMDASVKLWRHSASGWTSAFRRCRGGSGSASDRACATGSSIASCSRSA